MAKSTVLGTTVLCGALVTACASGGSNAATPATPAAQVGTLTTRTEIKVGTSPAVSNVPLYLANSPGGAFGKANLTATPKVVTSGAQAVPLLLNGQLQFTAADALGVMVAVTNNTPLQIVASGNVAGADAAHDNTGLIVRSDRGLTSASSLSGKTVAVNALKGLAEITMRTAIDSHGGDSSKVKFIELPIPQMSAAVASGTVDGAVSTEPFLSQAKSAGLSELLPAVSALPGVPQIVYVTSKSYAASHPEVVKAFASAITASNQQVTQDPSLIKKIALTSTSTSPAVLDQIILPVFSPTTVQVDILKKLQDLMVKYGAIRKTFDPAPYVYSG